MTLSPMLKAAAVAAAIATLTAPIAAHAGSADQARSCFFINQWQGWSAPDRNTLYLRVNQQDIYKVDLVPGPHSLRTPGSFLINRPMGSNSVCTALDLNLAISDGNGFSTPLIARSLVKLSPEQAAAIPNKWRP